MQTINELKELLEGRLSKKRYIHSLNVADEAKKLAKMWGEDTEKAYFAGLLHDICKETPKSEQKLMVLKSHLNVSEVEKQSEPLWHSIAGAWYVRNVLLINDDNILNAIRYHTVGRCEMSLLEEIIYIADLISADRSYKDVGRLRKLAYSDIKKTVLEGLRFSIEDVVGKMAQIPVHTINAYNFYLTVNKNKK